MLDTRKRRLRYLTSTAVLAAIALPLTSCRTYEGDGELVTRGMFSPGFQCQVYFKPIPIQQGTHTTTHNFTGVPCGDASFYVYVLPGCPVENGASAYGLSYDLKDTEEAEEQITGSKLQVGIDIFKNGETYKTVGTSLLKPEEGLDYRTYQWLRRSYTPSSYRHRSSALNYIDIKEDATYEMRVVLTASADLSSEVCIQPFLAGGASYVL